MAKAFSADLHFCAGGSHLDLSAGHALQHKFGCSPHHTPIPWVCLDECSCPNGSLQWQQSHWRELFIKSHQPLIGVTCMFPVLVQYRSLPQPLFTACTLSCRDLFRSSICTSPSCRRGRHTAIRAECPPKHAVRSASKTKVP